MHLTNEWYFYQDALSAETCDEIIELGHQKKFTEGKADTHREELTDEERKAGKTPRYGLSSARDSNIAWADNQNLYDIVFPIMWHANEAAGWNFDIQACETPQITQYKVGQYYKWHNDGPSDSLSVYKEEQVGKDKPLLLDKVRKLSMTILLNEDYKGGQFQIRSWGRNNKPKITTIPISSRGSIVVFPSFLYHRVKPVTKGIRYSMVAWFLGPHFK